MAMERPPPIPGGRYIVLTLKSGWTFDRQTRRFASQRGDSFSPGEDLPKHTRIQFLDSELASADPSTLSADEGQLARTLNLVPRSSTSVAQLVEKVRTWPCVADAWPSPEVSLPGN